MAISTEKIIALAQTLDTKYKEQLGISTEYTEKCDAIGARVRSILDKRSALARGVSSQVNIGNIANVDIGHLSLVVPALVRFVRSGSGHLGNDTRH